MKLPVAVLTMVKDDYYFLEKWVSYYGDMFGRDALYIVSHGGDPEIDRIAKGCSIIRIPGTFDENFDAKRWRLLGNTTNSLRSYYDFVICGDVDEFVVLDPKTKMTLPEFLAKRKPSVITPIGLEVVHRRDIEAQDVKRGILKTRQHCRYSSYFSKPCIIGKSIRLSRGGHYAKEPELMIFRNLYLFHMKYCDYDQFKDTLNKRSKSVDKLNIKNDKSNQISAHWFTDDNDFGAEVEKLAMLPMKREFDFSDKIKEMKNTWEQRDKYGLWHFKKDVGQNLYPIPDRFAGIL